jgi:aspartyl-tRNA synthetase
MLRTHTCGEVNEKLSGKNVTLVGWVDSLRIMSKMIFLDIRDRYGIVQCVIKKDSKDFDVAKKLTRESCILLKGEVKKRPKTNLEKSSGKIEIDVAELEVLSLADKLPFDPKNVAEDIRLKYRYLDLRINPKLRKNLELRHKVIRFIQNYLDKEGFLEIQTPILTNSSPEGARDFIVPSRIHPGFFYALPQSPQQYKQLLMVAGMDRYFQIAPCMRDEDPRADRSPGEFYQLDLEMSFVEQEDILNLIEKMFIKMVKTLLPEKKLTFEKIPRLSYEECMKKYGTDKPDLRKNKKDKNELAFAWVVDFPLFEPELDEGHYTPMHHMFTMPKTSDLKFLNKKDAGKVKSYQHDLVLNGFEVGGGSIRIHDPEIQKKVFELIGFDDEDRKYFEHMLTAFKYGVPPHGGIAPGIDRLLMVLLGEDNLREVIAFPKNKEARDVMMGAPSLVKDVQLKEAHIKLDLDKKVKKGK